jgi:hypothetical protein
MPRVEQPGFHFRQRVEFLFSPNGPDQLWGPPSFLVSGYQEFSPGVKWLGREADSLSSSTEVKNKNSHASTPIECFQGVERDRFTFYFWGFDILFAALILHYAMLR